MSAFKALLALATLAVCVIAQDYEFESAPRRSAPARIQPGYSGSVETRPTPVPILKQINKHNEDGSYTYGYEGADGSFKIETKNPTGEVKGKYGYVDADGKLRVVEYGANKYGFQPAGEGITVAPPTLVDESTSKEALAAQAQYDDGSYYEPEPQFQQAPVRQTIARPRPQPQLRPLPVSRPQPKYQDFSVPQQQSSGPAPPRALSIPGAAPTGVLYSEQPRPSPPPRPVQHFAPAPLPSFAPQHQTFGPPQRAYTAPSAPERFAPQFANARQQTAPIQFSNPAPVRQAFDDVTYAAPRPRPQPPQQPIQFAPAPQRPQQPQGRGSVLDQLAKDYALPEGGSPALHDISFGYY